MHTASAQVRKLGEGGKSTMLQKLPTRSSMARGTIARGSTAKPRSPRDLDSIEGRVEGRVNSGSNTLLESSKMRYEPPQAPLKYIARVAGVGTGAGQAPAAAAPRGSISHGASLWNKAAAKAVETLSEVPESAQSSEFTSGYSVALRVTIYSSWAVPM